MQAIGIYRYGATLVEIFEPHAVRTTLPDGAQIVAAPIEGAEHLARARALGYGRDLWAMTRDHDRFHALLAHAMGLRESVSLRDAITGCASEAGGAEEDAVLAMQRLANLCRKDGRL